MIWGRTLSMSEWSNHISTFPRQEESIQQLLPYRHLMILAGQFGIGKTSELLHLMCCFSYGGQWHGLQVEPASSLYLTWEGNPVKLNERIERIVPQYKTLKLKWPWYIRFEEKKIPLEISAGRKYLKSLLTELNPRPKIVLLDPFKRSVGGDYSKPGVADLWVEGASEICREFDCSIITANHTNKIIYRTTDTPDVLGADRVKGAGDLLDGVSSALLIAEEKGYKRVPGPDGFSKTEWTSFGYVLKVIKVKDATIEFPLLRRLQFDRDLLRLTGQKWSITANSVTVVEE